MKDDRTARTSPNFEQARDALTWVSNVRRYPKPVADTDRYSNRGGSSKRSAFKNRRCSIVRGAL